MLENKDDDDDDDDDDDVRKVVEGTATLSAIEKEQTINERPVTEITVANCGMSTFFF